MSQPRIDNVSSEKLVTLLADLKHELDDLKTAQITSGRSGIKAYLSQSSSTWDFTGTVGSDSAGTTTVTSTYTVTFTGDGSQSPVMANLSFGFYVNGTDTAHQLTPQNNYWSDGAGHTASLQYGAVSELATSYSQTVTLITQEAITVYIKVYAVGSCPGTVSAVRAS